MRLAFITVIAVLLATSVTWAQDSERSVGNESSADEDRAANHLQTIGGSYFGTGDEFLYTGVTADPGAVIPESVSDGEPVAHSHGDIEYHQAADGEYEGRYDLQYYGQDSILGPLWGVPGETLPETGAASDDPRLTDPHVARPAQEREPSPDPELPEGYTEIGRTEDGKIIVFKSSADEFDEF